MSDEKFDLYEGGVLFGEDDLVIEETEELIAPSTYYGG
jgi:hypothetical protein